MTADFESISTVTVTSSSVANVEFTSIPGTYTHLQIRGIGQVVYSADDWASIYHQFNNDTGNNYAFHLMRGNGSNVVAAATTTTSALTIPYMATRINADDYFSGFVIDILDYANTNKYKTVRGLGGTDQNGSGAVAIGSGLWMSTSAITSIKLYWNLGNIRQDSTFALYGIRSA